MEDEWEASGIRAGIRTWENSLPQCQDLRMNGHCCFPRKAVHVSVCGSGSALEVLPDVALRRRRTGLPSGGRHLIP